MSDKFIILGMMGIGVFLLLVFHFTGLMDGILDTTTETVRPKETGSEAYEVHSVEFKGKKTFWTDSRNVIFETEGGTFVYPKKHVAYEKSNNDGLSITVTQYDRQKDRVILSVGEESVENIRTNYVRQFSENIKFEN